ncbi:hypothetical protein [Aquimarina longa]|uniref:hypothetical protein n=1 Tax=Aquimarina longa TaxID=1080221 RepID=UPI000782EE69|nr:hypothetical protein [Aquimarina longa]
MKKNYLDNPYYQLRHNSYCTTEIYVNDVLISTFKGEETRGRDRSTGFIPINQVVLQSGTYKIVGKMKPRKGEESLTEDNAYLGIEFYVCNSKDWDNTLTQFHPKIESPWDGLSENINYPTFEISTEIEVELPFVLDGWQNSEDLSEIKEEDLFAEVLSTYRQIHAVMASHNVTKFLELSKEKMALQEQAFYFSEERKKSFMNGATELFNQKLEIVPLDASSLQLEIMGYGKLVRLIRIDGSAALQYKSPDSKTQGNVEFDTKLHMRSKEKGFSII